MSKMLQIHYARTCLFAALLIGATCAFAAPGIEDLVADQTGPTSFSISFRADAGVFPVEIYAASRPDRYEPGKPVAVASASPVTVNLPSVAGRVYFHLKPKSGQVRVVSLRRLPLEGAPNFRDLGGYRTSDGRHVRWGVLYRSGQLSGLTAADYQYLSPLGLRVVCDFRTDMERQRSPTKWAGQPAPEILPSTIDTVSYYVAGTDNREHLKNVYHRMPFDGAAEFGGILRRMAQGQLPVLVHCTAGKDRTGFFTTILLTALGVPRETTWADFMLTNRFLVPDSAIPRMAKELQERMKLAAPPDADAVRAANGVDSAYVDIAYQVINEKCGSFDAYVRDVLKVSDAELRQLRDRLLE